MVYVDSHTRLKKQREPRKAIDWQTTLRDSFALLTSGLTIYALIRAATAP
jgi:hypothetical protein